MAQNCTMTETEAKNLKSFKEYCTCGGHAWQMNGRPEASPHMAWCPQAAEYAEWWAALHPTPPVERCGGCGNADPEKRCIGCGHNFFPLPR
jgi:hypothetical protein